MISIVITTYNRSRLVSRAIDSALAFCSSIGPHEIIVVDDCSQDDTLTVVQEKYRNEIYQSRVRVLANKSNLGVTGAKNRGYDVAVGEWVGFLDSDDSLIPDHGRAFAEVLNEHPSAPIVFFRCQNVDGKLIGMRVDHEKWLDLQRYFVYTSFGNFGETFTVINKKIVQQPPYLEELRGYEGLGCSRIIARYGPALLSNLIVRIYTLDGSDRLSMISGGLLGRLPLLAKGHRMVVAEFWSDIPWRRRIKLWLLSLIYDLVGYTYSLLYTRK